MRDPFDKPLVSMTIETLIAAYENALNTERGYDELVSISYEDHHHRHESAKQRVHDIRREIIRRCRRNDNADTD